MRWRSSGGGIVSYKVVISPKAMAQLESYIDYVHDTLRNPIAAERIREDAVLTGKALERVAGRVEVDPAVRQRKSAENKSIPHAQKRGIYCIVSSVRDL